MRVFLQCYCNCSPVPFVAARCWPAPPLHPFQEAALVALAKREHRKPHRANLPVKRAKRRTRRKTKMVGFKFPNIFTCTVNVTFILKVNRISKVLQHPWWLTSCIVSFLLTTGDSVGSQEDQLCMALVSQLNKFADKETLIQFLRCFLLESNSSAVRWQAHCLALHIYRYYKIL